MSRCRPIAIRTLFDVLAIIASLFQIGAAQTVASNTAPSQGQPPQVINHAAAPATIEKTDAALARAKSLLQDGKVAEAELRVRRYLKEHANSADGHFLLGYALFRKIQADASGVQMDSSAAAARDGQPKEETAKASLAEYTEGAKYHDPTAFDLKVVALDYVLLKDYPDADKWLTKSLAWNPEDTEGWYYLGRTKYNENRFEEAIQAFQQCLKMDPASLRAEYNLGLSYQGLGRTEDAATAFRTAIAWQEHKLNQDSEPFIDLGSLLLDKNQPQEALPYLLQAVAISPQEYRSHEQLGRAYEHLDQLKKAQTEFEKAVALAPQYSRLHYVLGQVYRKEGLSEKAKLEFDRSSTLRRDSPSEGH